MRYLMYLVLTLAVSSCVWSAGSDMMISGTVVSRELDKHTFGCDTVTYELKVSDDERATHLLEFSQEDDPSLPIGIPLDIHIIEQAWFATVFRIDHPLCVIPKSTSYSTKEST